MAFGCSVQRMKPNARNVQILQRLRPAWLVNAGVALPAVRDLLGHSTVKVTERYAHLAPENVRAAVDALVPKSRSGHVQQQEENAEAVK